MKPTRVSVLFSEPDLLYSFHSELVNLDMSISPVQDLFRTTLAEAAKEKHIDTKLQPLDEAIYLGKSRGIPQSSAYRKPAATKKLSS